MARVPSKTRKKIEWLLRRAEGALLPPDLVAHEGAHLEPAAALTDLGTCVEDVAQLGLTTRIAELSLAIASPGRGEAGLARAYVNRYGVCGVRRFDAGPARIYLLEIETLPKHINNLYVIVEEGMTMLFDCGSGLDSSKRDLALSFAIVRAMFGESVTYEGLDWCVISHAHIDHFGGANVLKQTSRARIAVHELDARVLKCFDERIVVASKDVDVFWRRAGVSDADRASMNAMYGAMKRFFRPQEVDRELRDRETIGPGYEVIHVPGHCPGQVCLRVHDVLLTGDHILARTTPHQFPQAITPFAGLEHYFHSLEKVRALEGIRLALGGHEEPITDLRARSIAIEEFHRGRLASVIELCQTPKTVLEVASGMFGEQEGYATVLAIEEAGAHVEYLHQLGRLRIANLDEVAVARDPIIQYVTRT